MPFSLFRIEECRLGTSGGTTELVGVACCADGAREVTRWGGKGGASTASLILFEDPEFGIRRGAFKFCSFEVLLRAVVDFACVCIVFKLRLGTGGGGGLFVGL